MSRGRYLQVGDEALTDYNGPGPLTRVTIVDRDDTRKRGHSKSGILFRVAPNLRNGGASTWYDADWFEPVPNVELRGAEPQAQRPLERRVGGAVPPASTFEQGEQA